MSLVHDERGRFVTSPIADRFWAKVDRRGPAECWEWTGYLTQGYGNIRVEHRMRRAHRVMYELLVGPIPDGLTLDHLCRNRACVNPAHLEPVTSAENVLRGESRPARHARQTHCQNGHLFDIERRDGGRDCRTCLHARQRRYEARQRAAIADQPRA